MATDFKFSNESYQKAIEDNFTIIDKDKKEVDFILNPPQVHFFENATDRNVILKARKMGFSSVLLGVACIKFLFGKNERCVSMSFDASASMKQLERAKHFLRSYERKNKVKIPFKYNSKTELVLEGTDENGQTYTNALRIGTAKTSSFGRGDDITFLHLTEVSSADNLNELLAGVGEAVVNDTMITLETTANGYNEFKTFWDEAVVGARGYKALFYDPSWEYSEEYLERRRQELGRLFDQEYPMTPELAFIASGEHYFAKDAMKDYLDIVKNNEEQEGPWRKYRDFEPGEFVVCFADTAAGGGDFCAAQFLSKTKIDVPLVYHKKTIASEMTPLLHAKLEEIADITGVSPVVAYERNNGGVFELERLATLNRNHNYKIYQQKTGMATTNPTRDAPKLGWDTNSATRPGMLGMLKEVIDKRALTLYDRPTINEMFSFVEVQTSRAWRAQAEQGAHDDLIMALAGAWQMYQTEEPAYDHDMAFPEEQLFDEAGNLL